MVFGPDDFAATLAAARLHEPERGVAVDVPGGGVLMVPPRRRRWWYRGAHRQNGFRLSVRDLVPSMRVVDTPSGRAVVPYAPMDRYMRHVGMRIIRRHLDKVGGDARDV